MLKSIAITTQEILTLAFGSLPLILFLVKKTKSIVSGVIFIYALGSFITDSIILYDFYKSDIINNSVWLKSFTLFELMAFSAYFIIVLPNKWYRVFIVGAFSVFLIAFIQHWNSPSETFDSIPASIGAIICILYALIFLYYTASNPQKTGKSFINTRFWFAIGIFIYMAGNLFMFVTYNSFQPNDAAQLATVIFPLMNIIKNIFFSVGMIQKEN